MDSWQTLYTLFQGEAQDNGATILTAGKADINRGIRILETECDLPALEKTRPITTTLLDTYPLPQDFVRLKELYVTISNTRYIAQRIYDEITWQTIKALTASTSSNNLTHVFVRPGSNQFEIFPKAATAGNIMTMIYEATDKDLSADDYTTGNITTLANGGTTVTFSGSTLTAAMVGRWLKVNADGDWYKLDTFTSTTVMAIKQLYQGTAIAAGSAPFTIGEMSRLPFGRLQRAPVSYALWRYFKVRRRDEAMAKVHKADWDEAIEMAHAYTQKHVSSIIPSARRLRRTFGLRNPNAYPQDLT